MGFGIECPLSMSVPVESVADSICFDENSPAANLPVNDVEPLLNLWLVVGKSTVCLTPRLSIVSLPLL